jgi:3-phosphoshikimate 1-carboxyvinyltransferase
LSLIELASYFFSLVALSDSASITLTSYKENSLQGDSALVEIYKQMGVDSRFENNSLILTKDINFTRNVKFRPK